jgi:hypothetical protein
MAIQESGTKGQKNVICLNRKNFFYLNPSITMVITLIEIKTQHKSRSKVTTYGTDWRELSEDGGGPGGGGGGEGPCDIPPLSRDGQS